MIQQLIKAQKNLKYAQLVGIGIFILLFIAKRNLFHNYQFVLIAILALITAIWSFKNIYILAKNKSHLMHYSKVRLILWVCGFYAFILLLLSVLELYIYRDLLF